MSFFLWQCFTGIGSTYWKGLEWQGTLQCLVLPSVSRGCTWGPGKGTDVSGLWSVHSACTHSVLTGSLWTPGLQPSRLLCPWDSPGKNTGVGCHFLLQGIFPTQGSNWRLLCHRWTLCHGAIGKLPLTGLWTSPKMVAHHKDSWLCA